MRRPLCCVCVAFVATVFLYLQCNPLPGVVQDCTEGERITLFGEVCKKEYQSGYQGKTLVIRLENVQRWCPGMGQDGQQAVRGDVICYACASKAPGLRASPK